MKTGNDFLTPSQRVGGLAVIAAMLLVFGFFAWHQLTSTGFYTARFGPVEMLALYGPILISFAAPIARAVSGQRNPARPFQAAANLSLALGSLWLAIVFPFDFSHLADVLPSVIRFALSWITDDIARFVLILQVLIGAIATPLTIFTYISIRQRASAT